MNRDIYLQQVGLKALGFDPGDLDGIPGKDTRAARAAWEKSLEPAKASQVARWNWSSIAPSRKNEVAAAGSR